MNTRALIVNADDLGQSAGITRGVIEAHERGIVTSASLMALWPASAEAAAYARAHPALSVGLHVDLGEWAFRDGAWEEVYTRLDDPADADAVERQVRRQLECCRDLLGRNPTHLDSHQHVHWREPLRGILQRLAQELAVPLRHFDPMVQHYGGFYGQSADGEPLLGLISAESLMTWLLRLPEGITELSCHPGYADDVESMYRAERTIELRTLCDPAIRQVIADEEIHLVSFAQPEPA